MDAKEFEKKVGRPPHHDDLDRVNCPNAGEPGHWSCGWCPRHDLPRFECGCLFQKYIHVSDAKRVYPNEQGVKCAVIINLRLPDGSDLTLREFPPHLRDAACAYADAVEKGIRAWLDVERIDVPEPQ